MKRRGIDYLIKEVKSNKAVLLDNKFYIYYKPWPHVIERMPPCMMIWEWSTQKHHDVVIDPDKIKELRSLLMMYKNNKLEKDQIQFIEDYI